MRYARSARRYIAATAVTGMVTAVLVVAQAFLISSAVSSVISEGAAPSAVRALAVALGGVLAYTVWSYKVFASRISVESINPDQGGLHPTLVRDSAQPEAHFGY